MIKTIITMVVTAIAGLVGYLVSDSFRERLAQKQRDKIASEVARGDEAAVNARIGRFRALGPWVLLALVVIVGCAVSRTCYVREQDKVTAIRPGETYSNATEAVEWVVPRTVMTQLVIANAGLRYHRLRSGGLARLNRANPAASWRGGLIRRGGRERSL